MRAAIGGLRSGVNEMEQSSIIIHKGGKEEKYEIYVEDYVISFLKEETGSLELPELFFYGYREKNGRKYRIYGVGRDSWLDVFKKYDFLEEVGCRLTQAGPVFLIREKNRAAYEVKGYEIFYQDNQEMQSYMIAQKNKEGGRSQRSAADGTDATVYAGKRDNAGYVGRGGRTRYAGRTDQAAHAGRGAGSTYIGKNGGNRTSQDNDVQKRTQHSVITVQLGMILVVLSAIVINSANSYDKMRRLNQSAAEVFFAMENQEAEESAGLADGRTEIVVERNVPEEEEILKLAALENEGRTGEQAEGQEESGTLDRQEEEGAGTLEAAQGNEAEQRLEATQKAEAGQNSEPAQTSGNGRTQKPAQESEEGQTRQADSVDEEEELEALSRNVTRYYEVERGDTLYTICQKIYGDTAYMQKICELNQITDPDHIRYGQKIILP